MDEGIFKTKRCGLVGGRQVDIQWMWNIEARADRLERACRPPKAGAREDGGGKQLSLPKK